MSTAPDARVRPPVRPGAVHLYLLRGFEVRRLHAVIALPPNSQRLVAFLAMHDRSLRRSFVAGTLWMDTSDERANANLRSALWRIPAPGGQPLVGASSSHVWLDSRVEVDFRNTLNQATSILDAPDPTLAVDLTKDLGQFGDDLLPDWYDDWVVMERERFRQVRLHALDRLTEHLIIAKRFGDALQVALAAIHAEPLHESAHRQVIRVHLEEGNIAEAVRQYRWYARLLDAEIGAQPSPAMEALVAPLNIPPQY